MADEITKEYVPISQQEAAYVELSPRLTKGEACATCRFFNAPNYCTLIVNSPKAIQNTGYCNRFELGVGMDAMIDHEMVMEVAETVTESVMETMMEYKNEDQSNGDNHAKANAPGVRSVLRTIQNFWRGDGELPAFKALGDGWWFASYTNNFEDVENEILSMKAHDRYLARVQNDLIPMPELWFMHTRGTKHGQAEYVWRQGHVVMAMGKFDRTEFGRAMEKYYLKSKSSAIKLSHAFLFPKEWGRKKIGNQYVYEDYNTYEITTLPIRYAQPANPYSNQFIAVEEISAMPMDKNTRAALLEATGNEQIVQRIETLADNAESQGQKVADIGVAMKAFDDLLPANKDADKRKDENGDAPVTKADGDLLEAIILNQEAQQKTQEKILDYMARFPVAMKSQEDKIKELEQSIASKDALLNAVPEAVSVQSGNAPATTPDSKTAKDAKNTIHERQAGEKNYNAPRDAIDEMNRAAGYVEGGQ